MRTFSKIIQFARIVGGELYCEICSICSVFFRFFSCFSFFQFLSQIIFFSFFFQIIRCLIKPLSKKQHPHNFSRGYLMSGSNTQSYDCLDGTLMCTPTFGSEKKKQNPVSTFLWVKLVTLLLKAISMSKL